MAIIGRLPDINKHFKGNPHFEAAFNYFNQALDSKSEIFKRIQNLPLDAFEKVELGNEMFALEQKFYSKSREECFLESHIDHIDIQLIITGEELVEQCCIEYCSQKENFYPERDLITYNDFQDTSKILLQSGDFAIFFPQDIHLGCQKYQESVLCTKTVIKMPVKYFD